MKDFWGNVHTKSDDECWEWQKSITRDGHGRWNIGGKRVVAHRIAFTLANPHIDINGKVIRHTCDNPPCCNPSHLLCGTHDDNVQDRVNRGRSACGIHNGRSKLTENDVRQIRKMLKTDVQKTHIAKKYRVDRKVIYNINMCKNWTCVVY